MKKSTLIIGFGSAAKRHISNKYMKYAIDTLKVIEAIKISSAQKGLINKINYR